LSEERIASSLAIEVDTVANEADADTSGRYCPRRVRQHHDKTPEIIAVNNNHKLSQKITHVKQG